MERKPDGSGGKSVSHGKVYLMEMRFSASAHSGGSFHVVGSMVEPEPKVEP